MGFCVEGLGGCFGRELLGFIGRGWDVDGKGEGRRGRF